MKSNVSNNSNSMYVSIDLGEFETVDEAEVQGNKMIDETGTDLIFSIFDGEQDLYYPIPSRNLECDGVTANSIDFDGDNYLVNEVEMTEDIFENVGWSIVELEDETEDLHQLIAETTSNPGSNNFGYLSEMKDKLIALSALDTIVNEYILVSQNDSSFLSFSKDRERFAEVCNEMLEDA